MNGLCREWYDGFRDPDIHTLMRVYLRGQRDEQGEAAGNPPVGGTGSAQAASGADSTSDGDGAAARTP